MSKEWNRLWYQSLIQIGIDIDKMKQSNKTVNLSPDSFSHHNNRAMELILHALFTKFDPIKSKEIFRSCWPIFDKKMERIFRKACIDWLNELCETHSSLLDMLNNANRKPAVLLMNPLGEKFNRFILQMCLLVIYTQIQHLPVRYVYYIIL